MANIVLVYHSVTGTTRRLAESIAGGVARVEHARVQLIEINPRDIIEGRYVNQSVLELVEKADAVVFGSPTFMGCVSAQFKAFADASGEIWAHQGWANKLAGGFTIGSNLSGDQLNTIQYMQIFANQHGMIWAGLDLPGNCDAKGRNRLGAQSGLIAHSVDGVLHDVDLVTAEYLGARIATLAARFTDRESASDV